MAQKTNKSYLKRLKITKNGKDVARSSGQNHFNAKESRRTQLNKKRSVTLVNLISNKAKSDFLPHVRTLKKSRPTVTKKEITS